MTTWEKKPDKEKARTSLCGPRFDLRELRALIADPLGAGVIAIIGAAQEVHCADYAWPMPGAQAGIQGFCRGSAVVAIGRCTRLDYNGRPAHPQAGPLLAAQVCGICTTFPPMWHAHDQHDAGNHGLHQEILF